MPIGAPLMDLTGQKFGKLEVVRRDTTVPHGSPTMWVCKCECGKIKSVRAGNLRSKNTRSCGCSQAGVTHGMSKSRVYMTWVHLMRRCPEGEGDMVCRRWRDFKNFSRDMGERPKGTALGRIDPDGKYEPSNCRWMDISESRRYGALMRKAKRIPTPEGMMRISEAARKYDVDVSTIRARISRGWPDDKLVAPRYTRVAA